ncbi:hypothetical protein HYS95_01140 [Candidatus Daviesbacteria bacterium]|nr:hypothetical protein [Candidatus Daviesbacteria bacterium]
MRLRELEPDLLRIHETIIQRRDQTPQDPNSTTVKLLNTGWVSKTPQILDPNIIPEKILTKGNLTKPAGISDKLLEEAVEIAQSPFKNKENIIEESAQALYHLMVGCVIADITPAVLFKAIDEVYAEQKDAVVPVNKLGESAAAAVSRVALAGVTGNQQLILRRSTEAIIGLNRFWEAHQISPAEVGKEI